MLWAGEALCRMKSYNLVWIEEEGGVETEIQLEYVVVLADPR